MRVERRFLGAAEGAFDGLGGVEHVDGRQGRLNATAEVAEIIGTDEAPGLGVEQR